MDALLDKATQLETNGRQEDAVATLKKVLSSDDCSEAALKVREKAIYAIGRLYGKLGRAQELKSLLTDLRPFFALIPKARTTKIVRSLIDLFAKLPGTEALQVELCLESIAWASEEKRTFLRQRVETRLAELYFEQRKFQQSLELLTRLLKEVRRLDDKPLLVEIQLLECRVQHGLKNLPKSKAALTSARTAANAMYCPPFLQAQIDAQSGVLHAEEKDYKTAYSYFFESFEAFSSLEERVLATRALKYMLLCQIMANKPKEAQQLVDGSKAAQELLGREVEAMLAVASAHDKRSIHGFQRAKEHYSEELGARDGLVEEHLGLLYDTLLEQNLSRVIEPFSCVEVAHIARLMDLDEAAVEKKLSKMILDHKLNGVLDQGAGWLLVFADPQPDELYPAALDTLTHLVKVVDALDSKAQRL